MIKIVPLLALIVLAQGAFLQEQETPLQTSIEDLLKCFNEIKPVIAEIPELINAVKAMDFSKVIELVYKIVADGKTAYQKCIEIFVGEKNLQLSNFVISLIIKYGRAILKMLKQLGLESQKPEITAYLDNYGYSEYAV